MNFTEIANTRQSCRNYDPGRAVESEKLERILESARLSPSACNGQPYQITVCKGDAAKKVAAATQGMGMNKFAPDAPVMLVISEMPYVATAALGAKMKKTTTARLISESRPPTSPPKQPRKDWAAASSDGWMTRKSAISAIWTEPCVWSSPSDIPQRATSSAQRSARISPPL